jgi:chromodomain-helicase-DNA-binding protein 4
MVGLYSEEQLDSISDEGSEDEEDDEEEEDEWNQFSSASTSFAATEKKTQSNQSQSSTTSLSEDTPTDSSEVKRTPRKRNRTETVATAESESPPLLESGGRGLKILGFGPQARASFLKLVMMHGVRDGSWSHILDKIPLALRAKSPKAIVDYGNLFLRHLSEPVSDTPTFLDGTPKEGIDVKNVLIRIGKIHAILFKLQFTPFYIDDQGTTELHRWWSHFSHQWKREHDEILLRGTIK